MGFYQELGLDNPPETIKNQVDDSITYAPVFINCWLCCWNEVVGVAIEQS